MYSAAATCTADCERSCLCAPRSKFERLLLVLNTMSAINNENQQACASAWMMFTLLGIRHLSIIETFQGCSQPCQRCYLSCHTRTVTVATLATAMRVSHIDTW
jgi:hypothetical protein